MNLHWLDSANRITPEVQEILVYFCKDTTERILRNVRRMDMRDTGQLMRSIHTTIYNNAAGDDALIRFYYMNYGSFLEHGLGKMWNVDSDLGKKRGVRRRNVDVAPISGSDFGAIVPSINGLPKGEYRGKSREQWHVARPAIHSEIRLHLRGTQERLAKMVAFTATAYLTRGLIEGMTRNTGYNAQAAYGAQIYNDYVRKDGDPYVSESGFQFNFVADTTAEEAWLAAKGYLKTVAWDWRLANTLVGKDVL